MEAIKAQIGVEMADLGLELNHELKNKLTGDYVKQTIRSAGIFGDHILKADNIRGKQAGKIIMSQVGDGNWSDTVWKNTDELKARLDIALQKCMIEGKIAQQIARELRPLVSKEFKNAKYASERLARTESTRVQANATLANLKRYGYDYCKWIAEPSACKICASIADSDDGWGRGVYKVADVPDLPVHPNCRCAISAYWLDKPTVSNSISDVKQITSEIGVDKVAELFDKINIRTASKDDIIKLGQAFNKKYNISDKIGDKDAITKAVSVYRQTGGTVNEDKWVERSVKAVKNALNEAFNHYPTDWVNYLNNTSEVMFAGKNKRGFYIRALSDASGKYYKKPSWVKTRAELAAYIEENNNGKYNTIYSSGRPTTAWHEIGHFVEDHNADVVRIEKEFVEERTKGERPTRLVDIFPDWGYSPYEVVKKDNFINPYIGKEYASGTEVLSVGLESVFEPQNGHVKFIDKDGTYHYAKITDDPEYMDLILGLLLKG